MKRFLTSVICLLIAFALVIPAYGIQAVKITGISLDNAGISLNVGESKGIGVKYIPANTTQKLLQYTTSNKNVASVTANGTIVANSAGSAVITVTSASNTTVKATCTVTVKKKSKVVLNLEIFDRGNVGGTQPDNNVWTNWIKENFNKKYPDVTLKFITCPRWQEVNKLNIWMASNQAPDLCLTYDVNSVFNYYKNGGLTQLDTALDAHGSDLKAFLGNDVLKRGKYYGQQWSIPAKRVMNARQGAWIRQDWLDALGMKSPATTMEYYNTMKAFKEKNPGKVGKVVPMAITQDVDWTANWLLESFLTDKSEKSRYLSGGVMKLLAPGYKDGMRFLNKMYSEGLLSSEFPLDRDGNLMKADFTKGYVGSYINNFDLPLRSGEAATFIPNMKKNIPGFQFVPVDPFKDKDGVTTKGLYDQAGLRIIVPKSSEKKVNEAMCYLNWMADKDVIFYLQYGKEGVNHTIQNGLPIYKVATGEYVMNSLNNLDYTYIVNGIQAGNDETNLKVNSLAYGGVEDLFIQAVTFARKNGYIEPTLTIPCDADAKYSNTLSEKLREVYAKVVTCKPEDFDGMWNKMLNEYLRIGGNEVLTERKKAWKEENNN